MSMPFYVAPEQVMKDRADYARKGIARGRGLVALTYDDGVVMVAENPSNTLRKISEIYDRIAFAGVGKYNEFDQLRVAGVRAADIKGYQYSRDDVDARSLANQYAQILGQVFTHEMKPLEVEILVAEVGVQAGRRRDVPRPLRRHRLRQAPHQRARRRRRCRGDAGRGRLPARAWAWPRPSGSRRRRCRGPSGRWSPASWRRRCWPAATAAAHFRRIDEDEVAALLT